MIEATNNQPIEQGRKVLKRGNPLQTKRMIRLLHEIMVKSIEVRRCLKLSDDTFAVLVVLLRSYMLDNCGLTRSAIYYGCGNKTESGYSLMRQRLTKLVNSGLIEIIGMKSCCYVYIPSKRCIDAFAPLIGKDNAESLSYLFATA